MTHYNYCWNRPMDLVDLNGMWPKWVENTVKAVTVVATVVAVGAVVVGTGGAAAVVVAGALTTGVVSGFANEASGGSYTNGFIGGTVAGTVQSIASFAGPVGNVAGGAANGLGSFITDSLDNIDSSVAKKKSNEDVIKDAGINAAKGTLFSLPGGFMQWATSTSNTTAQELMKGYNSNSVYGTC
ncbi:MAG: hypothetical protein U0K86_02040 [Agathobacter sp.]|nr:hypothetical protein [Agathobacter sp.]